jgi:outer membrane protein TolC
MRLAETRQSLAATRLKTAQEDARNGTGSADLVAAAQAELYRVESALVAARADFYNTWAEFVSTVSTDPALRLLSSRYTE